MMTREQAKAFASQWLPAWTGDNPEKLISFYSEDVFYSDPANPLGIRGKENLLKYFQKLLAKNPDWIWTQRNAIPMEDGFLNQWIAKIPMGEKVVECLGVCTVQFREGLIYRNETYFDTAPLLSKK